MCANCDRHGWNPAIAPRVAGEQFGLAPLPASDWDAWALLSEDDGYWHVVTVFSGAWRSDLAEVAQIAADISPPGIP